MPLKNPLKNPGMEMHPWKVLEYSPRILVPGLTCQLLLLHIHKLYLEAKFFFACGACDLGSVTRFASSRVMNWMEIPMEKLKITLEMPLKYPGKKS